MVFTKAVCIECCVYTMMVHTCFYIKLFYIVFDRLERAKKLQEQREKEMVEKQKQQEMAAGNLL